VERPVFGASAVFRDNDHITFELYLYGLKLLIPDK